MHMMFSSRRNAVLTAVVLAIGSSASSLARAIDCPVSGDLTINGQLSDLPPGGSFANSDYNPVSGVIDAGTFTFPVVTETSVADGIVFVFRYQFTQTDSSAGVVAADGVVALATARFRMEILSITANGVPYSIGQCTMQPIMVELAGTASVTGLDLVDTQFTIPPVPVGQCGIWRDSFNQAYAGDNNAMSSRVLGNFTPPSAADVIFKNGFDSQ